MMLHYFDVAMAQEFGVNAAVIFANICYWIEKNRANGRHCYDGRYWTYNSLKAFGEMFPYLSERQIRFALQKLVSDGLIITGCYNREKYDRTAWYALTPKGCLYAGLPADLSDVAAVSGTGTASDAAEETGGFDNGSGGLDNGYGGGDCGSGGADNVGNAACRAAAGREIGTENPTKLSNASDTHDKCICHPCQMDLTPMSNAFDTHVTPIPNINTYINTNINTDIYNRAASPPEPSGDSGGENLSAESGGVDVRRGEAAPMLDTATYVAHTRRKVDAAPMLETGEYEQIIGHLNDLAGTHYRASSRDTRRRIDARIRAGFTVEDCIRVIDSRVAAWLHDARMREYLRPETLFGTKFESYLNAPIAADTRASPGTADLTGCPSSAGSFDTESFFSAALARAYGNKNGG